MRDDVLKIVNREQLVSCMNNTRWLELLGRLNAIRTDKRVKYIDSDRPSNWQPGAWMPATGYVEFSCGPTPFRFIEWLEVKKAQAEPIGRLVADRITDRSEEIRETLALMNLDVEETCESFIVYGYRRATR